MIFINLDNTTELYMTKYIIGECFSSDRATLYKNPSDQTVYVVIYLVVLELFRHKNLNIRPPNVRFRYNRRIWLGPAWRKCKWQRFQLGM